MLNLFINSALIENMVFAYFFGMCSYIAVSKSVKTALGLGAAVTFVQVMTVPLNFLLNKYVLSPETCILGEGIDLSFLSFILFIAVIAAFVQLVEMVVEKFSPSLYNQLGIFLPLIAVNCAIMGGSLFMQQMVGTEINNVGDSIVYGLGSGIGWWLAIVMMAAIREKIEYSHVPAAMKGPGIAFIITGLMGIAFMIFSGIQLDKLFGGEEKVAEPVMETVAEEPATEPVEEIVIENVEEAQVAESSETVEE
jgi:Na+-transporting NADH:ubiquinone oxidoreductase subunit E